MTKDEIMNAWKSYYKASIGITLAKIKVKQISDAEVFEQMAIEQYKGTLQEWLQKSTEIKNKGNFQDYGNNIALRICEDCWTTVKKGEAEICPCCYSAKNNVA